MVGPVEIVTAGSEASCGFSFEAGEQYLVYATKESSLRLSARICSRTRLLSEARDDLRFVTSMPSPADGGRIFGRISE